MIKRVAKKVGDPILDDVGRPKPLTEPEKAFLAAMRQMARAKEPFTYRRICEIVGWKGVQMAWQTAESLAAKGRIAKGKRLAMVECPVEVRRAA